MTQTINVSIQSKIADSFVLAETAMKKAGISQTAPEFAKEFIDPGRYFCPTSVNIPTQKPNRRAHAPCVTPFLFMVIGNSLQFLFINNV
jgi:hypothetical protein